MTRELREKRKGITMMVVGTGRTAVVIYRGTLVHHLCDGLTRSLLELPHPRRHHPEEVDFILTDAQTMTTVL
jgi:hypothetical protein